MGGEAPQQAWRLGPLPASHPAQVCQGPAPRRSSAPHHHPPPRRDMLSRVRAVPVSPPSRAGPMTKEDREAAVRAGVADLVTDAATARFVSDTTIRRYLAARSHDPARAVKALR